MKSNSPSCSRGIVFAQWKIGKACGEMAVYWHVNVCNLLFSILNFKKIGASLIAQNHEKKVVVFLFF